jgi:hypothetical protein
MSLESFTAEVKYSWQPFSLDANHLSFGDHVTARLERHRCNFWGPAVYKWEGIIKSGPHMGKRGVLIGETSDLRQRIKQYVSGTQERGNKLWRETFLKAGDIHLYILCLESFTVSGRQPIPAKDVFASNNLRLVLEQLLVMQTVADAGSTTWVVNARQ